MTTNIENNTVEANPNLICTLDKNQQEIFKSIRRISSPPIVAFQSHDHLSLVKEICDNYLGSEGVRITWDFVKGFLASNAEGSDYIKQFKPEDATNIPNLLEDLLRLNGNEHPLPTKGCLFILNAHVLFEERFTDRNLIIQQLQHLARSFKAGHRTIVLLMSYLNVPIELREDVTVFEYNYPNDDTIVRIIDKVHTMGKVSIPNDKFKQALLPDLRGLTPKTVQNIVGLAIRREGLQVPLIRHLRDKSFKRKGLSVYDDDLSFKDLGGFNPIKKQFKLLCEGRGRPDIIVWNDECEKDIAGFDGDNTGATQDQMKILLEYMHNFKMMGCIFLGITGTGKSQTAKAIGKEFGIRVLKQDLGGTKQKELGNSEQNIRENMELIRAVGRDRVLYIATCNDITKMPAEFLRRFSLMKVFFDLPNEQEKVDIWRICRARHQIKDTILPDDRGYSHDDIDKVCYRSYLYNISLLEAAKYQQPCEKLNTESNRQKRLYAASHGLLSASYDGFYVMPKVESNGSSTVKLEKDKDNEPIISFEDVN